MVKFVSTLMTAVLVGLLFYVVFLILTAHAEETRLQWDVGYHIRYIDGQNLLRHHFDGWKVVV